MSNGNNVMLRPRAAQRQIELRGVRVHNLKNLDLDIPLDRLVVISGVSGSGKGSLAFETLVAEGQRRYIESFSIAARQQLDRIEKPNADRIAHVPVAIGIRSDQSRRTQFDPRSTMATIAELLDGLKHLFARVGRIICLDCNIEVRSHSASDVVNTIAALPPGARCQIGVVAGDGPEKDFGKWLQRGFSRAIWDNATHDLGSKPEWPSSSEVWIVVDRLVAGKAEPDRIRESVEAAFREGCCWLLVESTNSPTHTIDGRTWRLQRFSRSLECPSCGRIYLPTEPRLFSHFSSGACLSCRGTGRDSTGGRCAACQGTRLRDEARAVRITGKSIADLCAQSAKTASEFVDGLQSQLSMQEANLTSRIRADITHRLSAVSDLGLDYLNLDRAAETMSGGECRRLMLAAAIGSKVTGTLTVIDEPSAGLAVQELPRLETALRNLLKLRNSVIVVDHAPQIITAADHVIELGPGAGPDGGQIVYQGSPRPLDDSGGIQTADETGAGLAKLKQKKRASSKAGTRGKDVIVVSHVHHHNLNDRQFEFPLNQLCVVTGVSGSGKTSLVTQVLYPAVCRHLQLPCAVTDVGDCEISRIGTLVDVVLVDQSPLSRSSRSNPATWLDVFGEIRETFAGTADAKLRGYTAVHFSFNSPKGGRCKSCQGSGILKQDMQFLPDVTLPCPECGGTRYGKEILEVKYRGRSIADVLAMSVTEAASFFRSQPRIQSRFQMLKQFGLDYLVLGQPSETLSGGEAQRLKLAARLAAPMRGPCLILCDEPTNGLHPKDIKKLVAGFRELLANGHSLILADNSPDLLAEADSIIELGQEIP